MIQLFKVLPYGDIVIAALVAFGIGALWYSQKLFGKRWMMELGITEEMMKSGIDRKKMAITMGIGVALSVIQAIVLYIILVGGLVAKGASEAPIGAVLQTILPLIFLFWIGFSVPIQVGQVLWEKKSWTFFLINGGYNFIAMLVTVVVMILLGEPPQR